MLYSEIGRFIASMSLKKSPFRARHPTRISNRDLSSSFVKYRNCFSDPPTAKSVMNFSIFTRTEGSSGFGSTLRLSHPTIHNPFGVRSKFEDRFSRTRRFAESTRGNALYRVQREERAS